MVTVARPLVEITRDALRVLCKEVGIVDTLRSISQFTPGYGNYTQERGQLSAGMTVDDIISEIKRRRNPTDSLE